MTLEELQDRFPLGSTVKINSGKRFLVIGYEPEVKRVALAYIDNDNGQHNLIGHFCSYGYIMIKEGIEEAGIPINRHAITQPASEITIVQRKRKWRRI